MDVVHLTNGTEVIKKTPAAMVDEYRPVTIEQKHTMRDADIVHANDDSSVDLLKSKTKILYNETFAEYRQVTKVDLQLMSGSRHVFAAKAYGPGEFVLVPLSTAVSVTKKSDNAPNNTVISGLSAE